MRDEGGEVLWKIFMTIFVIALLIGSMWLKYDCCRSQGFTRDQCVYDMTCNG